MNKKVVVVGIADLKIAKNPDSLSTLGLGSCVGIALYDSVSKIAGLAHIMLPDSGQSYDESVNMAKFADTAIISLLKEMIKNGAKKDFITAKLAGGAQMFALARENDTMKIGERNIKAATLWLRKLDVTIIAKDTGGNYGRSIELFSDTGIVTIKTIGHGNKTI